jgi:hypothetical protein
MKKIRQVLSKVRWRERTVHYGNEYADKQFYVIRRHANRAGLFSFAATNLGSILTAVEKGYLPVIDMQNSPNPMLTEEEVGKVNAWDRYFLPPCGYTLADIAHAKNVTLGVITPPENEFYPDYKMILNSEELRMWREAAGKYLHVRPEIQSKIDVFCWEEFGYNENKEETITVPAEKTAGDERDAECRLQRKVLGVLCRGTDYVQSKPCNHPIQPKTDAVIAKCREVMSERHCDCIYLCTEDEEIWEQMNAAFPGKIHSYQQRRFRLREGENINDVANTGGSPYERNLEYLISIGILARCSCLVAGAAGGTYGALLLTQGYEYEYVFKIGRYGTDEPQPGTWEYENAAR